MKRNRRIASLGLAVILGASMTGCGQESGSRTPKEEFVPEIIGTYEAEDAVLNGNVKAASGKQGYSGSGYVEGFQDDNDSCSFTVSVPEDGFYDLNFVSASAGGEKYNYVWVDGEQMGTVYVEKTDFTDCVLNRVYLTAGEHKVSLSKYWGWICLDYLALQTAEPIDPAMYEVTAALSNPKSSDITKRLYSYLLDIYGEKFLSGQYCDTGQYGKEFQIIKSVTGKTPAVLGLDFIEYSPSRAAHGSTSRATDYAIDFWNSGGIVTFAWHWNAPEKYLVGEWWNGFRTEGTNLNLTKIMNGQDPEGYDLLMEDIDAIAQQLLILKEAGVPILWRPLHEASGGWFWWGAFGPETYKQLYITLYDKLTKDYKLNNLIWLWNGQDADWYPGDEYVDIIGEDIYPGEKVYTSQAATYLSAANYGTEYKMVYLSENGCLFDPDLAERDGAMWGMWCTWGGEFVAKNVAFNVLSEQYTEESMIKKVYEHEDVITLEDLPDFSKYKKRKGI